MIWAENNQKLQQNIEMWENERRTKNVNKPSKNKINSDRKQGQKI